MRAKGNGERAEWAEHAWRWQGAEQRVSLLELRPGRAQSERVLKHEKWRQKPGGWQNPDFNIG